MKLVIAILISLMSVTSATAWEWNDETEIQIGISFTNHYGFGNKEFNEVHPYVSITDKGWKVEAHINSFGDVAFGVHNCVVNGVEVGFVTGYSWTPLQPVVKLNRGKDWIVPTTTGVVKGKDPLNSKCSF